MSKTSYWYCPNCREEIDPTNVTFQELHDSCGHAVEWIEGIEPDRLEEICAAERDGRCGEDDSPIITWQLYNLLAKSTRAEAEAALTQEGVKP